MTQTTATRRTIRCGHCGRTHSSVAVVRSCAAGMVTPCGWLVERHLGYTEDGATIAAEDCGADCIQTETGWSCEAGHSYVNMETRHAQGWDYATDDEAVGLLRAGTEPVRMNNGASYWDAAPMEPSWEQRMEAASRRTTSWGRIRELHRAYND